MSFSNYTKTETLWPTYVFHYEYENFGQDKQILVNEIYEEAEKQNSDIDSSIAPAIKKNLKESKFSFLKTNKPAIQKLRMFFEQSLGHMISQALPETGSWLPRDSMECVIRESWYHITNNKGYHLTHMHPGSSWSGIFYVESGDSNLEEMNGINTWFDFNVKKGVNDSGSEWFEDNFAYNFQPKDGTLILFPGWLPHDACPYQGEKDRIVVSINSNFYYKRQHYVGR